MSKQTVKTYSSSSLEEIKYEIEDYMNRTKMKVAHISISAEKAGYSCYHYAIVVFEE